VDNPLWLEPVLERHLVQVAAPEALWHRIQNPGTRKAEGRRSKMLLVPVAAALAVVAAWTWLPRHSWGTLSDRELAVQALNREPEDLDLRSDTVTEIRTWVKSRTGLDLPLPARTADTVRLTGVCAVKGGVPAVEVSYRVKGRHAALLVSKAGPAALGAAGNHRFLKCESIGGTRVSSWTMRGQLYTLAYSAHGDAREECLLCHNGG
jgi:hypothetical protein